MPTGAGKTKAATEIIKRRSEPVWFVCHRQEIERQAAKAFAAAGIDFGVVSPRAEADLSKKVQIVSVGALAKRVNEMPAPAAVIWDECHHVAAKSWAKIREALSAASHLGLTATPERLDGKGLSEWFAELIVGPSTRELIDDGHLSEFRYFAPSDPDLRSAKLQAGDYKKSDIAKIMNTPVLIGDAVSEYKAKASGKRAIVFCASVEASQALVDRFNAEGVPARHIDGTTPDGERDAAINALADGSIKVLSNVEVFTEGFDLPAIDVVFLLRPTKSLALFLQMIGRALRKADGKDEALIFDHAGLWLDHGWFADPISWSLDGGAQKRRFATMGDGRLRRCPQCDEVRAERVEACGCGYEFPTGREIGEYDGQLWELRSAVPEGCESRVAFAERLGVSTASVCRWLQSGLPATESGHIMTEEANLWLEKNGKGNLLKRPADSLPGHESKQAFAARVGVDETSVLRWIKQGMPHANGQLVAVSDAIKWLAERNNSNIKPMDVDDPESYESKADFAKRLGVWQGAASRWATQGLPCAANGWVHIEKGIEWVERNHRSRKPPKEATDNSEYEPRNAFAARIGRTNGWVSNIVRRGSNIPCASNGWVHIQRGLEWVRDNTNIQIPPEAWPAANDNEAERITAEMHAAARTLLADRPKKFGEAA
ncbi:ATP-dependent helicase protein [Rhizobium phage RHph_X2_25]|nr:ATP-dependent helicase protein [Rhizobium phage RHph_X2_25]